MRRKRLMRTKFIKGLFLLFASILVGCTHRVMVEQDYVEKYYELGIAYQKSGHYNEAIKAYGKVIELEPGNAEAYYALGWNYGKLNHHYEAIAALSQAIRL